MFLDNMLRDSKAIIQYLFEGNHTEISRRCSIWWTGLLLYYIQKKAIFLYPNDVIESFFNFTNKTASYSLISSDPLRVCFCSNESEPDFAIEQSIQKEAYAGQIFLCQAVAVCQYNGTTPDVVLAVTGNTTSILREIHLAQQSKRSCTRLQYSISSINEYEVIQLVPAGGSTHFFLLTSMLHC